MCIYMQKHARIYLYVKVHMCVFIGVHVCIYTYIYIVQLLCTHTYSNRTLYHLNPYMFESEKEGC